MASSRDKRRLLTGARAIEGSKRAASDLAEAFAQRERILEGLRALQSLDDLGQEENAQALGAIDELFRRLARVNAQISGRVFP